MFLKMVVGSEEVEAKLNWALNENEREGVVKRDLELQEEGPVLIIFAARSAFLCYSAWFIVLFHSRDNSLSIYQLFY